MDSTSNMPSMAVVATTLEKCAVWKQGAWDVQMKRRDPCIADDPLRQLPLLFWTSLHASSLLPFLWSGLSLLPFLWSGLSICALPVVGTSYSALHVVGTSNPALPVVGTSSLLDDYPQLVPMVHSCPRLDEYQLQPVTDDDEGSPVFGDGLRSPLVKVGPSSVHLWKWKAILRIISRVRVCAILLFYWLDGTGVMVQVKSRKRTGRLTTLPPLVWNGWGLVTATLMPWLSNCCSYSSELFLITARAML